MVENYNEILHENETIETENLTLRKFRGSDAEDLYEYASDKEVMKYLTWSGVRTLEEAKGGIYNFLLSRPGIFAIELKENSKCIGTIDFRIIIEHERAEFGYMLNRNYWGRGIMSEALSAILALCFEKLELNRVDSGYFIGNEASGRVMEKCGMIKEGVARKALKAQGIFRDHVLMGILREDYINKD